MNARDTASRPAPLLRARVAHGHARVTFVELFFDLVFVFAVTQLSHALLHDLTALGALRTTVLFLAVWCAWINTAWVTNWLDPDRGPTRAMLFALMLAGLLLSIAIPEAYAETGLLFAAAYAAIECGRSAFVVWAVGERDPRLRRNFLRILCWQAAAAPFWLLGGAVEDPGWRLVLWAVALAVWTAGPPLGFRVPGPLGRSTTADWTVEGGHMAERCALFVIIALGESLLVTGATFEKAAWTTPAVLAFLAAFAGAVAMWWVYFHVGAERASEHIAASDDPGRVARLGFTYLHAPVVAGIVLAAVADERVLHHPGGHVHAADAAVILGGPALYLLGLALFKRLGLGRLPLSHLIGLGLLAALAVAAPVLSPLGLAALSAAALAAVAAWEHASLRGRWARKEEATS